MEQLKNIHPGEVLKEEFLKPHDLSAYRLSKEALMPQSRLSEILKEKRSITPDTALKLSKFFGTSAKFWLGLQNDYDLEKKRDEKKQELNKIKQKEVEKA